MDELLIYQTEDGLIRFDVRMDGETVWLSLNQIADLFGRDKSTISRHIKNIFVSGELIETSVVANFATTASDKKTYEVQHFNLDLIISVGYRVNSIRGTQFRIWATQRLKEYLLKGFTLDDKRLKESSYLDRYFDELTERILARDVTIAKNYLNPDELSTLNNVVEQYLIFAEGQAKSRKAMRMQD